MLVELDRSAAEADVEGARAELASARAEILRRKAALVAARAHRFDPPPDDRLAGRRRAGVARARGPGSRRRSRAIGRDPRLVRRRAGAKDRRARQAAARPSRRRRTSSRRCRSASTCARSSSKRRPGAKAAVIDATETLQYQITQQAKQEQDLASLSAGLDVIARDSDKAVQAFVSDDAQKLEDAERRVEDVEQRLAKAQAELDHLTLRAPIAGRVQSSIITNVGQVVASGQEIMRIVPEDSGLEIEAYVRNRDIGFVSVGQEAVVKVESFPFTRYGAIKAHVVAHRQGRDSRARRQCDRGRSDARLATRPALPAASAPRIWCSRWCSSRTPRRSRSTASREPLTSGMAVTVELKTGARRMLEYLFSPLVEVASKAMRER